MTEGKSPSQLIAARIKELSDWRGGTLARVRALVKEADPDVVEEWKWRGVPVWEHAGIICTGETYKNYVKMTFARGASLELTPARRRSAILAAMRRHGALGTASDLGIHDHGCWLYRGDAELRHDVVEYGG